MSIRPSKNTRLYTLDMLRLTLYLVLYKVNATSHYPRTAYLLLKYRETVVRPTSPSRPFPNYDLINLE